MGVVANDFDIANLALDHLSITQKIATMNDASESARVMKRWYDIVRKALIRHIIWEFAEKRAVLVEDTAIASKHPHFKYAYSLPADFFVPTEIVIEGYRNAPSDWKVPYQIRKIAAGGAPITAERLYTDMPPQAGVNPLLSYAIDHVTIADYPDHFVMLFSHALAATAAAPLRVDEKIVKRAWSGYQAMFLDVTAMEKGMRQPDAQPEASWILARY